MRVDQLDYELPPDRIAAVPAEPRDAARLLVIRRQTNQLEHHHVRDLPQLGLLNRGDLLVVNQTRVLPAYLVAQRTHTGGHVSGLYLSSPAPHRWLTMLEARGSLREGETLTFANGQTLSLLQKRGGGQWLVETDADLFTVGVTPLPPYIRRARKKLHRPQVIDADAERYNTVYATEPGSIAAPTAGLHLTPGILSELAERGIQRAAVTLHVGVGTFAPIRCHDLSKHQMHHEQVRVPIETIRLLQQTRAAGGRIVPVGTTTIRALESLPEHFDTLEADFITDTSLFIYPDAGFRFRFADSVMTNFHLPRSTLLAMIAALAGVGIDRLLCWYQTAVAEGYRFYSYGDAMWVG
ncbi:MAG: tRNA preQ1(34) S-adenosylmethionine ribosyltransferase-isomerase QueA [Phycisphaeraceae bacterium]|nr:tRNA preQ1(34) S-adenosylmethionine ribosyltransferase-isomerase QueA [Phycisphaeraceae bacterium]